jgi:hypothetical protein
MVACSETVREAITLNGGGLTMKYLLPPRKPRIDSDNNTFALVVEQMQSLTTKIAMAFSKGDNTSPLHQRPNLDTPMSAIGRGSLASRQSGPMMIFSS